MIDLIMRTTTTQIFENCLRREKGNTKALKIKLFKTRK